MTWFSDDDIERLFTFRKWSETEVDKYRHIREGAKALARHINTVVPECPQKTRAINTLHEALYLVNTAVTLYPLEEKS